MIDIVLMKESEDILNLGKKLGFDNIIFFDEKDICSSMKEVQKKKGLIILKGGDEELNRKAIESKKINILLNPEPNIKDSLKQKNSGLNQVLCKLANDNKVMIAFSLDRITNSLIVGKIIQNIKLCRKYKVKTLFFTLAKSQYEMRQAKDLISLLRTLGMTPGQAKSALENLKDYHYIS